MRDRSQLILTLMCALAAFSLGGCLFGSEHSTDEQMISNFQEHRSEFEQLLEMIRSDKGLLRVDDTWTLPEDPQTIGVSRDRINEYRNMFYRVGVPRGFSAPESRESIELIATTKGLSVTGSAKGYAWLASRPVVVVDDLDTYWSKDGKSFRAFRHIEGNWYLWFDYED